MTALTLLGILLTILISILLALIFKKSQAIVVQSELKFFDKLNFTSIALILWLATITIILYLSYSLLTDISTMFNLKYK